MKWIEIKDHPNRCWALGIIKGEEIVDIVAKVHRLDTGDWAYACKSDLWKSKTSFFLGKEPSRKLAIEAVDKGMA